MSRGWQILQSRGRLCSAWHARHGIALLEELGPVGFIDPHTLAADGGRTWTADRIILAVGGHADRGTHAVLGAHVLGEYAAETVQTVAACMAGAMTIEQVAELQLAFPTFTEGVSMAAQKICRALGTGRFPRAWTYLAADD